MVKAETEIGELSYPMNGELAALFRAMSKQDTLRILFLAGRGIENSTHAIEELGISSKRYYARLKGLLKPGLVKKVDGVYRQTALGKIMHDRFLPAMGRTFEAKDKLELLMRVEGTDIENEFKRLIEDELGIPGFAGSSNLKSIDNYESMVVDVIDICDEAKESILLASNYLDVRILDTTFRSMDRGVKNSFIVGREVLSSRLKQIRIMFSPKVTMAMLDLASKSNTDMGEIARVIDLPYSFCVVDGHINIIETSDARNASFIAAFSVKDRGIGEKLTDSFEKLWNAGESHSTLKFLSSLKG